MSSNQSCCSHTFGLGIGYGHKQARIEAFAAIRRAAEVAREYDLIYREAFAMCDCSTYSVTPGGDDVRRAIRAAIGSEKT